MLKIKIEQTERGFNIARFKDRYNVECSLQDSSLASEPCIWLGCDDAAPQVMMPGKGWQPVEMPPNYIAHTRMHLTVEQVKALLPYLQAFVDNGSIAK